jgi:hypothetical protein
VRGVAKDLQTLQITEATAKVSLMVACCAAAAIGVLFAGGPCAASTAEQHPAINTV